MSGRKPEKAHRDADETFVDERGVTLTRAGVERAARRLAETRARHDDDYFTALRDRLGIPPHAA